MAGTGALSARAAGVEAATSDSSNELTTTSVRYNGQILLKRATSGKLFAEKRAMLSFNSYENVAFSVGGDFLNGRSEARAHVFSLEVRTQDEQICLIALRDPEHGLCSRAHLYRLC